MAMRFMMYPQWISDGIMIAADPFFNSDNMKGDLLERKLLYVQ